MKLRFGRGVCLLAASLLPGLASAYLLVQPAYAYNIGYTIGDTTGHWSVFQPFTVTGLGWDVSEIDVDGFTPSDPAHAGAMMRLLNDDGAGRPDETHVLANKRIDFATVGGSEHWSEIGLVEHLNAGRYWLKLTPGNNNYWGAIYNSETGEHGFSRNSDGVEFPNGFATVLRIDGNAVPEPGTLLVMASWLGALAFCRRRLRR